MNKKLKVSEIVKDAGTQVRAWLNKETVAEYAKALKDGAKFPAVIVFHHGDRYVLADGFHRIEAAIRADIKEIECDIREGSKTDALKFALGSNTEHGLRRTNADKFQAVMIALREFAKLSDRALAAICLVGHPYVARVRRSQLESDSSHTASASQLPAPTRIGRDGVERRLPPPTDPRTPNTATSSNAEASSAQAQLTSSPPPSEVLDAKGFPVPTHLIPLWKRGREVDEMLKTLSQLKRALRAAEQKQDPLFAEIKFSSALPHLEQAGADIKTAKPYAVCSSCQGQIPGQCTLCKGRGFVSEFLWETCVTQKEKEIRDKAQQEARGQIK